MIKTKFPLLALLLSGIIWISCDKKVVYPPVTQTNSIGDTAKQYWGYGGDAYSTRSGSSYIGTWSSSIKVSQDTFFISGGLVFYASRGWGNSISLKFYAKGTGAYILSNKNTGTYFTSYPVRTFYGTDSIHTGILTLTKLDTVNHYISGTFWFSSEMYYPSVNGMLDTVRNGYFTNFKW
jgi:hypothetical protein